MHANRRSNAERGPLMTRHRSRRGDFLYGQTRVKVYKKVIRRLHDRPGRVRFPCRGSLHDERKDHRQRLSGATLTPKARRTQCDGNRVPRVRAPALKAQTIAAIRLKREPGGDGRCPRRVRNHYRVGRQIESHYAGSPVAGRGSLRRSRQRQYPHNKGYKPRRAGH